jgi:hypothetical protein
MRGAGRKEDSPFDPVSKHGAGSAQGDVPAGHDRRLFLRFPLVSEGPWGFAGSAFPHVNGLWTVDVGLSGVETRIFPTRWTRDCLVEDSASPNEAGGVRRGDAYCN